MTFLVKTNLRDAAEKVRVCTKDEFWRIATAPETIRKIENYRRDLALFKEGQLTKEEFTRRTKYTKGALSVFMFHAADCINGVRSNAAAKSNGMVMLDLDHLEEPVKFFDEEVKGRENELGIIYVAVTPSGEGLRIVAKKPNGLTLPQAQYWLAAKLGDVEFDKACKDLARCSFANSENDILYVYEEPLFSQEIAYQVIPDSEVVAATVLMEEREKAPKNTATTATTTTADASSAATSYTATSTVDDGEVPCFKGVPYSDIIEEWFALPVSPRHGKPEQGERNTRLSQLVFHLRNICDKDEALLLRIVPRFGLGEEEMKTLIHSACKKEGYFQTRDIQQAVRRAAAKCGQNISLAVEEEDEEDENNPFYRDYAPQLPKKLPGLVKLCTSRAPEPYRAAIAMAIFPPLCAHVPNVKFKYRNDEYRRANITSCLIAPTGAGKSCINTPINAILADIDKRDTEKRKKDKEFKRKNAAKGAYKDKDLRPDDLGIQIINTDISLPKFYDLTAEAHGRLLYSYVPEIEYFNKFDGGNTDSLFGTIKNSFDSAKVGQDRVGEQSVSERVEIGYVWNASTTPTNGRKFWRGNIIDGAMNRVTFSTIPKRKRGAPMPEGKDYTENFYRELQPYIDNLNKVQVPECGYMVIPQANALARKMRKHCAEIAVLSRSDAYESVSFRAVVLAWEKACVLYLANGCKWEKSIEDFCMWSLDYDLYCKFLFFGDELTAEEKAEREFLERKHTPGKASFLSKLPEFFTLQQLQQLRAQYGSSTAEADVVAQLANYVSRKKIIKNADGTYTNLIHNS